MGSRVKDQSLELAQQGLMLQFLRLGNSNMKVKNMGSGREKPTLRSQLHHFLIPIFKRLSPSETQ